MLPLVNLPSCQRLVVALSGGVDSMVLLHWLKEWWVSNCPSRPLLAIHVNHGLSPNAINWQNFVTSVCDSLGIPLITETVVVNNQGNGIEQAARRARYAVFAQHLIAGDVLAMAHHANDQTETLLLRLLRGAGVQGLAAMPLLRPLGDAQLWRPFLNVPKAELLAYATQHQLRWVEDESNHQQQYSRNFLRASVIPLLEQHWPQANQNISRAALHLQESQALLDEYSHHDLIQLTPRIEKLGYSIDLVALTTWAWNRQKQLVRYWLKSLDCLAPEAVHLEELKKLITAQDDATPVLIIGSYVLARFQQRLHVLPLLPSVCLAESVSFSTADACEIALSDGSYCRVEGLTEVVTVTLKWRQGGERSHPEGRQHSQTLKKLMQEYRVPPWLRDRVPLLYINNTLVAVADYWLEQGARALYGHQLQIFWRYPSELNPCFNVQNCVPVKLN